MKKKIHYLLLLLICNFVNAQMIFQKNITIPSDKIISVSLDGSLIALNNFPEEIEIISEPVDINGKTIFNIKVNKKWEGIKKFTVLNSLEEYYNVSISINDTIDNPYIFLTSKNIVTNNNSNDIKVSNNIIDNKKDDIVDSSIYMHDARNINSQLKRDYKITKKRINGIEVELFNVLTKDNLIYVRVKISNNSPYDFVLNDVFFAVVEEEKFTKKTADEESITCIYMYDKKNNTVYRKKSLFKTFVFRSFKLMKNQFFKISFSENRTKENIEMYVNNMIMNNPKILNSNEMRDKRVKENKAKEIEPKKNK